MARADPRLDAALDAVITIDALGRVVDWNPAAVALFGYPLEEVRGRVLADLIVPCPARAEHTSALHRCVQTGEGKILNRRVEVEAQDKAARLFPVELTVTAYLDGDERFFTAYLRDISERRRRMVHERILSAAGVALLEHPRDPPARLAVLARLLVPEFAIFCSVAIVSPNDSDVEVRLTSHATASSQLAESVLCGSAALPLWHAIGDTAEGVGVFDLSDPAATPAPLVAHFLNVVLGIGTLAVLTIAGPEGGYGFLLCGRAVGAFHRDDVALLEELSRRASLAIENAMVYEEQARTASALQASLLPPRLPSIPGAERAAHYHPASGVVGGDFYDIWVRPVAGKEFAFAIGDVSGSGVTAAALTALCRHTLATAALDDSNSAREMLHLLDRAIKVRTDGELFATAIFGEARAHPDGLALTLALGGHPEPLLVTLGEG